MISIPHKSKVWIEIYGIDKDGRLRGFISIDPELTIVFPIFTDEFENSITIKGDGTELYKKYGFVIECYCPLGNSYGENDINGGQFEIEIYTRVWYAHEYCDYTNLAGTSVCVNEFVYAHITNFIKTFDFWSCKDSEGEECKCIDLVTVHCVDKNGNVYRIGVINGENIICGTENIYIEIVIKLDRSKHVKI